MMKVKIANFFVGNQEPLALISGPCVIESESDALFACDFLKNLTSKYGVPFVFKSSYDKANRSAGDSFRGPGIDEGLKILEKVKHTFDVPVLTDVHSPEEAAMAGEVCDVIQIPAFLCRQTDLLFAAAKSGAVINVKKGQFMAPWDMKNVVDKLLAQGNDRILLTDRGTSFGYNNLVSDMRCIPIMQKLGFPVVFDGTHSVQLPGGLGTKSGGEREFIGVLSKAAIASGCNALFIEAHPDPKKAKSDAASMLSFEELPKYLEEWLRIYDAVHDLVLR